MKSKKIIAAVVAFVVVVCSAWMILHRSGSDAVTYRFAEVERGSLEASVSATGTLSAVTTVQVGTQVSGQVSAIYVDFNDHVRKGQLLARIDPTLAVQSVREAEASIARSQADLAQAQSEYDRNSKLFEAKVITEKEMNAAKYALQIAQANTRSSQVGLERARRNLAYTEIYAPVDGIVVERNVDVGQTVAASLSAPQLFLIAQDLSEMQILASVDESDIGSIHEGQDVHFTVQAYDGRKFTGKVKQVRLQSKTQENVVSYTVAVSVENPDRKLLPGMTATVEFVTGSMKDALLVPNAALRFRPASVAATQQPSAGAQQRTATQRTAATQQGERRQRAASLWVVGKDGKPAAIRVTPGLSDGAQTAVTGDAVREGMQVIVGQNNAEQGAAAARSPLQPQPMGGGRRGF